MITYATLTAVFAAFIVLLQSPTLASPVPTLVFVVVAITPMLALALAGGSFASVVLRMTERWRGRATNAVQELAAQSLPGITRSVQQDRVTILNRDVVPFFAEMLTRDAVSEADRVRARAISGSIRALMVYEVDRTWLAVVVEETLRSAADAAVIDDPERLASAMSTDQRTAIRALLVGLAQQDSFDPARPRDRHRRQRHERRWADHGIVQTVRRRGPLHPRSLPRRDARGVQDRRRRGEPRRP